MKVLNKNLIQDIWPDFNLTTKSYDCRPINLSYGSDRFRTMQNANFKY